MEPTYESVIMYMPDGAMVAGKLYKSLQRNEGYMYIISDDATLYIVPGDNVMNEALPDANALLQDIGSQISQLHQFTAGLEIFKEAGLLSGFGPVGFGVPGFTSDDDEIDELDMLQMIITLLKMNDGPVAFEQNDNGVADVVTLTIYHRQNGMNEELGG